MIGAKNKRKILMEKRIYCTEEVISQFSSTKLNLGRGGVGLVRTGTQYIPIKVKTLGDRTSKIILSYTEPVTDQNTASPVVMLIKI
jgi:hypothetical protein